MLNQNKNSDVELGSNIVGDADFSQKNQAPLTLKTISKSLNPQTPKNGPGIKMSQEFPDEKHTLSTNLNPKVEEGDKVTLSKFSKMLNVTSIVLGLTSICVFAAVSWMFSQSAKVIADPQQSSPVTGQISTEENIHYLGILPLRSPSEMMERFSGVEKYLREETGLNIKLKLYPTSGPVGGYTQVVRDISEGKISFAYLASVTTVQAQGNNSAVVPFVCAQKAGSSTYKGDLVVRANSSFQRIEELEGKKVSGTSMSSTSGGLMPVAMLKNSTVKFDGGLMYLGSHDKAAEAVIAGTIDACFINEATFNKYNKDRKKLRSIWRHDPVPEFPFNVNMDKVSPDELAKVKAALLKMHKSNLAGVQSINEKYEKWVAIEWEDYLGVKKAVDEVYGEVFYDLDNFGKDQK